MCVCVRVHACVRVRACVCARVCVRERERERLEMGNFNKAFFLLKCGMVSRCTRRYIFMYAYMKCVTFFVLIFMKFTAAEQHCVQISISLMRDYKLCARTGRNLFTPVNKIFSLLPFSRNSQSLHSVCVRLFYLFSLTWMKSEQCADLLCQVSPKPVKKYGSHR